MPKSHPIQSHVVREGSSLGIGERKALVVQESVRSGSLARSLRLLSSVCLHAVAGRDAGQGVVVVEAERTKRYLRSLSSHLPPLHRPVFLILSCSFPSSYLESGSEQQHEEVEDQSMFTGKRRIKTHRVPPACLLARLLAWLDLLHSSAMPLFLLVSVPHSVCPSVFCVRVCGGCVASESEILQRGIMDIGAINRLTSVQH